MPGSSVANLLLRLDDRQIDISFPTNRGDPMTSAEPAHETIKFRTVTHVTWAHSQDIGDVTGHVASLARFSGLAFFLDGSVCAVNFIALTDYTNGAGAFTLYPILKFDDGSVLCVKSTGTATVDGAKTHFIGNLVVLGGKGRFEAVQGNGTLTGTRYTPLSVGADLVSEYTVNVKRHVTAGG